MSLGHSAIKFLGACLILLMLAAQMSSAQDGGYGTIKGRVFDRDTKEELPGANIIIRGTSIGTAADLNGEFTIPNAPGGEQTVVASYLGYTSSSVVLNIEDGGVIKQDFNLRATTLEGEVVIVTAQAQGQLQAINQQISSNKIVNIVSEAKIQELPDFNAAAAIGRLPGVSTLQSSGEANKIVIRGLAPQFNRVSVGGISLASTGSNSIGLTSAQGGGAVNNDRSVDLTMVTPYMIKAIEVFKTLTPDMEANAIGGSVNMELREAPSGLHGDVLWQSGYTEKTEKYGNYRGMVSLSNRFFDDLLGVYVLGNAEEYDRNADNMRAGYETVNSVVGPSGFRPIRVTNVTLNRHVETRKRSGGNFIIDYKLPNGLIKSVNMFSRLNSNYIDYNSTINYNSPNRNIDYTYRKGNVKTDVATNSLELRNDYGFFSLNIKAANTYSRNFDPRSPNFAFFQNSAIQQIPVDTNVIPELLTQYINFASDTSVLLGSTSLFSSDYRENDQIYKADFKVPINIGSVVSGSFKFGGEYSYNLHVNDQSTPYISINRTTSINLDVVDSLLHYNPNLRFASTGQLMGANFTSTDSKLYKSFLGNTFGAVNWAANPWFLDWAMDYLSANPYLRSTNSAGGWFDGYYQQLPNDYKYIEKYYAAFLMAELNFGTDLLIVGGARYEQTKGLYHAYNLADERNPASQTYFPVTAYPQNHNLLPMVQMRYNLFEWADMRYSYTQTLARPDYSQLSPHFVVAATGSAVFSGNPKLKPARAYNQDLLFTIHNNNLGLLSIGGFYKEIKDFAFNSSYPLYSKDVYDKFGITGLDSLNSFAPFAVGRGNRLNTPMNSRYKAYVRGLEADFQHRLWYLPFPFDGVVLGINYTHIWSSARYSIYDVKAARGVVTWYSDSTREGRLLFQPNDIMNSYIGYDYRGFSGRLSFLFQGNSVTNIGGFPEGDGFSKDYFRLDASAKQMLPWDGLQLFLDVSNLNSEINKSAQTSIGGFTSQNYYGLTANLGLRYSL